MCVFTFVKQDSLSTLFIFCMWNSSSKQTEKPRWRPFILQSNRLASLEWVFNIYISARSHIAFCGVDSISVSNMKHTAFGWSTYGDSWVLMVASPQSQFYSVAVRHRCHTVIVAAAFIACLRFFPFSFTTQGSNLKFSCHVTKSMRDSMQ